jgi:uncharacterized protein YceH (UPF0502 family)
MTSTATPTLSAIEARILGVLMEKQATTPDVYPLTLNALTAGCNQKTSRNPVMNAAEGEVQAAIDSLRRQTLVIESYGASGRVLRYAHNLPKVLNVGQATAALLAVLMLRGPQTAAELRANAERLYAFADVSSVEAFLEEMADRSAGALAVRLARQPGSREPRWAQLLSGPVQESAPAGYSAEPSASGTEAAFDLRAEVAALREEVATLRAEVAQLRAALDGSSRE